MICLPNWPITETQDPGLKLFNLARPLLPAMRGRVLEIGYRDTKWAQYAAQSDPGLEVHAIDWRKAYEMPGVTVHQGDILAQDYPPQSWDVIVGLSSFEHIGLGNYEHDPLRADGDMALVDAVREWLRPGGWCYFDVPYRPEGYLQHKQRWRAYDDLSLWQRLQITPNNVLGYTRASVDGWCPKPVTPSTDQKPFYYVACLIRN